MKTKLALLIVMLSSSVTLAAKKPDASVLPATTKVILETSDAAQYRVSEPEVYELCVNMANGLRAKLPKDLEYECEKVVSEYTIVWHDYNKWAGEQPAVFLRTRCVPRSLAGKQLYTAAANCEKDPQEFCWSDSFQKKLESFKTTEYVEFRNGSCDPKGKFK